MTYPDVVQLAVPFFIVAIAVELAWIVIKGRGGRYETRDALTSLLMGAGNVASGILLGFVAYGFFMWLWALTPLDLGNSLWVIVLCFVLDDLRYYWVHRFGHRIRWVWASHVNHHSSQHYNLTTALRQTWTGTFTFMMIVRAPLILLGFHPAMVLFVGGLNLIYQFWIHTEAITRLPRWVEAVMNTPSHHREWIGIWRDVTQPGLTVSQRLKYAFAAPGYSHDGSRDTSQAIKAKHLARSPDDAGTPGFN